MSSAFYPHSFEATVVTHDVGSSRYRYKVVFVPEDVLEALPMVTYPRLRISGEVNEQPIDASLTPVRGRWYLLLSNRLLRAAGAKVGDDVEVRFRVADQDAVDAPEALRAALAADAARTERWAALTPGKQRALSHRVSSAKTTPTQSRRVAEVFEILDGVRDLRGNRRA